MHHIVLLKLKKGTTEEQLKEMVERLKALQTKIPGIISFSAGWNVSPENKKLGFTYGFFMEFEDAQARDNYLPHPEHKRIGEKYILPISDDILVFDYET